jgi:hypothetical protein
VSKVSLIAIAMDMLYVNQVQNIWLRIEDTKPHVGYGNVILIEMDME